MKRMFIFAALLAFLLLSGCFEWQLLQNNRSASNQGANPPLEKAAGGTIIEKTISGSSNWKYVVYLPPKYNSSKSYPVIVGLHGSGGNAKEYVNILKGDAGESFILVFPQSPDSQGWNIQTVNQFVAAVVNDVRVNYNITNMYLTGHSAGARMIVTIALLNPQFRGVAMVDGAMPPWYCPPEIEYCQDAYIQKYGACTCAEDQYFYMLNGEKDNIVTKSEATKAKADLELCGANVTQRFLPTRGHEYPPEENKNIIAWFVSLENNKDIPKDSVKCRSI